METQKEKQEYEYKMFGIVENKGDNIFLNLGEFDTFEEAEVTECCECGYIYGQEEKRECIK